MSSQQPNGILPRPPSHSRRPGGPPPPQQQQQQQLQRVQVASERDDFMDDDDDDDDEFGMNDNRERQRPQPPSRPAVSNISEPAPPPPPPQARSRDMAKDTGKSGGKHNAPSFLKIAVIGESTVGKTVLCNSVTNESYSFNKQYHLTCGVNVFAKSVKVPEDRLAGGDPTSAGVDGIGVERLNMALLDSSGKDIYLEYLPKYWDKLDGFVVVFDLTNPKSLENASDWVKLGMSCCSKKSANEILGVLVGNKMDLKERRKISPQTAQDFASKNNLQYFECSVKENSGLEEPFFYLAHKYTTNSTSVSGGSEDNDKENVDK